MKEILAALFVLNRHAKRYRDRAQAHYQAGKHRWASWNRRRKEEVYRLKGQVLALAVADEYLIPAPGWHRFDDNYAESLVGGGYRFHRPCPPPENPAPELVIELEDLESRPKGSNEIGVRRAEAIVREFLADKPVSPVYSWSSRQRRSRVTRCWNCGEEGHIASECWEDDFDWEADDDFDGD